MTTTRVQSAGLPGRGVSPRPALPGELRSFWTHGRPVERWCYRIGALLIVAGLVHLGVFAVDGGPWRGPVSWRKPVTFGLSFGLTLLTITWVASFLPLGVRARRLWLGLFAAACSVEVGLITLQAWRRVPSHFNLETTFDAAIAPAHAVTMHGILVLPALAWLLAHTGGAESRRVYLVRAASVGYALLAGVVVAVSFAGTTPIVAIALAILGTAVLGGVGVVAVARLLHQDVNTPR